MADINTKDTGKFSEVSSYLSSALSSLSGYESKLNGIGSGLTGELKTTYTSAASPVRRKIASIRTAISGARGHIRNSLSVYALVDDKLSKDLNSIYDAIFNDEDYENRLLYVASGENKKYSYDEFVELVDNSAEYFNKQRKKVYDDFVVKAATAGTKLIKDFGTDVYNSMVENTYYYISDDKVGSDKYKKGLKDFKNKFGKEILGTYENIDFVPNAYTRGKSTYDKALLALTFDDADFETKNGKIIDAFHNIDERTKAADHKIKPTINNLSNTFYDMKEKILDCNNAETTQDMLDKYYNVLMDMNAEVSLNGNSGVLLLEGFQYGVSTDAWYDAIKNTKAYRKLAGILGNDKEEIYKITNNLDFLAEVYKSDGIEGLTRIFNNYLGDISGDKDIGSKMDFSSEINNIINHAAKTKAVDSLYNLTKDAKSKLETIDDNEKNALLLFAKDLDLSNVTDEDREKAKQRIGSKWTGYCDGNDYTKYLEDWQIDAYAWIYANDPDLASRLFNMTEDGTRGFLDEKIMEGYAFDVAKHRVQEMTPDSDEAFALLKGLIFSNVYGFGYGLRGFTDGISDAFSADGKMNRNQMEQSYITSLLAGDYTLYSKYLNEDSELMDKFSTDYDEKFIRSLKLKNLNSDEINELINDCKNNKVPKYELEYYAGLISYDEYMAYKGLANTSKEDLELYAHLGDKDNDAIKWFSDKAFKVSSSVGNMAIPTILSILSTATGGTSALLSGALSLTSYGSMFASSYGRTKESLMASGETDNDYIRMNALLHASLETFGEAAFGKVLKSPKWGEALKDLTAKVPGLDTIINASDNLNNYLVENGCNEKLAKYLSNILGEVIQENGENLGGWVIDALTSWGYKGEAELPTLNDIINDTWETTWMTALTTPLLNGMTNLSLSNVPITISINGKNVDVSLSDLLLFTNEDTNTIDYGALSEHLIKNGQMDETIADEVTQTAKQQINTQNTKTQKGTYNFTDVEIIDVDWDNNAIIYEKNGQKYKQNINGLINYAKNADFTVTDNLTQLLGRDFTLADYATLMNEIDDYMQSNMNKKLSSLIPDKNYRVLKYLEQYQNTTDANAQYMLYWANNDLIEELIAFGVSKEKAEKLIGTARYFNKSDLIDYLVNNFGYTREHASKIGGFHEGKTKINDIVLNYRSKHDTGHEFLHGVGSIRKGGKHTGINESLTECFAKELSSKNGRKARDTAYDNGAYAFERLFSFNIDGLTHDDFWNAYVETQDISGIRSRIDEITYEGYFDEVFDPSFEQMIQEINEGDVSYDTTLQLENIITAIVADYIVDESTI